MKRVAPLSAALVALLMTLPGTAAEKKLDYPPLTTLQFRHVEQAGTATPALGLGGPAAEEQYQRLNATHGEPFRHHPTYLYVPGARLDNGKRGLLVALHGCAQTAAEVKDWGNLESAAAHGLVIAIPSVGEEAWAELPEAGCWDYDKAGLVARDKLKAVIAAIRQVADDARLDIDRNHVYVTGLSSGGALSLLLACSAPDLIAGVGTLDAPAVGSWQWLATADKSLISYGSDNAVATCEQLANGRSGLSTQVANVAYGAKDRNGDERGVEYPRFGSPSPDDYGQYAVATTAWSTIDANMFATLYQRAAGEWPEVTVPKPTSPVKGGAAKVANLAIDGHERITLTEIAHVGHAWPSGRRGASPSPWIATGALNYPDYIAGWLIAHNLRAGGTCVESVATAAEHIQAGRARLDSGDGLVHAVGSNQPLGAPGGTAQYHLARLKEAFFVVDRCR